jgi:hypothetical protein
MTSFDIGFIQGMLDARTDFTLSAEQTACNPFDSQTERDEWQGWIAGYDAHRHPNIV